MSEKLNLVQFDIDAHRHGHAGVHDGIRGENINRTLKAQEILGRVTGIYLDQPYSYTPGTYKMLLVQGPHDEREGTALFPLGLGYIARVLDHIGVEVQVLDAHAEGFNPEQTLEALRNFDFHLVGITALSTQYGFVKWIASEIKKYHPECVIIVGGQLAHYNPHTLIACTGVDVCVIGEGEITIQDVIYNLDDLSKVSGIAYRDSRGAYRRNSDRPRILNPEVIPFPFWDKFKMEYYFTTGFYGSRAKRAINILSSRGCPYSCTFCSLSFPNVTYRSVDNVVEEVKLLKDKYGVDGIMFADELFVIDKKRVYEFCEKLKPLRISWGGQGRANIVNNDENLLRSMKEAGAAYIGFGLESATSEILTMMEKVTTVEQNKNSVKAARNVGLTVVAQYMFGFPGESLESIKAGVNFFQEVEYCPPVGLNSACHISLTTPLPGSQLYEDCKNNGVIGDEDEYLTKISRGYYYNEDVVVNLTEFSNDELLDLKYAAQEAMKENYVKALRKNDRFFLLKYRLKAIWDVYHFEGGGPLFLKVGKRLYFGVARLMGVGSGSGGWGRRNLNPQNKTDYIYRTGRASEFRRVMGI